MNLFRPPLGSPVTPDAAGELVERLARRADLERHLTPHMLRQAFGSNVADAGVRSTKYSEALLSPCQSEVTGKTSGESAAACAVALVTRLR